MPRRDQEDAPKRVISVAGVVGSDPEINETDWGDVLNFRLAVTNSYEDGAESTWFDVAVWNEGLIESTDAELGKGAKVAVEGTYSVKESGGKEYKKINAARVGIIEWLARSKGDSSKRKATGSSTSSRRSSRDDDDEEEEKPARRAPARSSRPAARTSRKAVESDDELSDLPW